MYLMRIGFDTRMILKFPTGVGVYLREVTRSILKLDKDNTYVFIHSDQDVLDSLREDFKDFSNAEFLKVNSKTNAFGQYFTFHRELKKGKLDFLITDMWGCTPLIDIPYFLILLDLIFFNYPNLASVKVKVFNKSIIRIICKKAVKILTLSMQGKEDIERYLKEGSKTLILSSGVSDDFLKEYSIEDINKIKDKFGIKGKYFIYVGNVRRHKNLIRLIDAFNMFKTENKSDVKLVFAGNADTKSTGKNLLELLNKIKKSPFFEDIIRTGYISKEDHVALLKGSIALVHPAIFEGFGMTPLEAMKAGVPVLCSSASKMKEMYEGGGIFLDPLNTALWAEGMKTMVESTNLRNILGMKGREIAQNYTWENTSKIIINEIKKLPYSK